MHPTDREQLEHLQRLLTEFAIAKRQVGAGVVPELHAIRAESIRQRILHWGADALAGRLSRGDEERGPSCDGTGTPQGDFVLPGRS